MTPLRLIACALCLAAPAPTLAQDAQPGLAAQPCGEGPRVDTIPEPWAEHSATYANGAVRIVLLDFIEPAAGPFHILVLSPPLDALGARQCKLLSLPGGMGFADVDFAARSARYDPATGLVITLPVKLFQPEGDPDEGWAQMALRINQASGEVAAQFFK